MKLKIENRLPRSSKMLIVTVRYVKILCSVRLNTHIFRQKSVSQIGVSQIIGPGPQLSSKIFVGIFPYHPAIGYPIYGTPNQARLVPMENRVSEVEQRTKAGGRWPVAVGQGIAESKMF